jgi:hypothetical protein
MMKKKKEEKEEKLLPWWAEFYAWKRVDMELVNIRVSVRISRAIVCAPAGRELRYVSFFSGKVLAAQSVAAPLTGAKSAAKNFEDFHPRSIRPSSLLFTLVKASTTRSLPPLSRSTSSLHYRVLTL